MFSASWFPQPLGSAERQGHPPGWTHPPQPRMEQIWAWRSKTAHSWMWWSSLIWYVLLQVMKNDRIDQLLSCRYMEPISHSINTNTSQEVFRTITVQALECETRVRFSGIGIVDVLCRYPWVIPSHWEIAKLWSFLWHYVFMVQICTIGTVRVKVCFKCFKVI